MKSRTAYKPDSVRRRMPSQTVIHLGTASRQCSCCQPKSRGQANPAEYPLATSIRHCSRWGLPCDFRCRNPGGLLPHRFTLASKERRSVLCGAFPRVSPAGHYPAPLTCGVRTFLAGANLRDHPAVRTPESLATRTELSSECSHLVMNIMCRTVGFHALAHHCHEEIHRSLPQSNIMTSACSPSARHIHGRRGAFRNSLGFVGHGPVSIAHHELSQRLVHWHEEASCRKNRRGDISCASMNLREAHFSINV